MSLLIRLAFSDHCFTFSYSTSCPTSVQRAWSYYTHSISTKDLSVFMSRTRHVRIVISLCSLVCHCLKALTLTSSFFFITIVVVALDLLGVVSTLFIPLAEWYTISSYCWVSYRRGVLECSIAAAAYVNISVRQRITAVGLKTEDWFS